MGRNGRLIIPTPIHTHTHYFTLFSFFSFSSQREHRLGRKIKIKIQTKRFGTVNNNFVACLLAWLGREFSKATAALIIKRHIRLHPLLFLSLSFFFSFIYLFIIIIIVQAFLLFRLKCIFSVFNYFDCVILVQFLIESIKFFLISIFN